MLLLGIILLVVGLVLALAPTGLRPPAVTIGWICVAVGLVLIVAALVDIEGVEGAVALPLMFRRGFGWRYSLDKRLDRLALWLAVHMPARLRIWVVVDSTNAARRMYPDPSGYAGPDGLGYEHIHDGALRRRYDSRA